MSDDGFVFAANDNEDKAMQRMVELCSMDDLEEVVNYLDSIHSVEGMRSIALIVKYLCDENENLLK